MPTDSPRTGLAQSLLQEIARALTTLAETGETAAIDLRSLPLTDGDRADLAEALGRGEVVATVEAAGPTDLHETAFPGIWWICHRNADGRIAAETIEVTPCPDILAAHPDDIRAAAARLATAQTKETAHV
ncbi:MAG: hypothetical protein KGK00_08060 [Paracoccaceae bacterium]|nr:hypothetical protein [Paracoccaceae bacterium]